jgi:CheY-like chemotaxis protein
VGRSPLETVAQSLILIVDDDPETRDALREVLEQSGFSVVEAADGREALAYLLGHAAPAVILLDLFMPTMDGWQFARQLRGDARISDIPVVVVTGSGSHWGYPADRALRKPIDATRLLEAVRASITSPEPA